MPQKSLGFAVASVRVRQGRLMTGEQLERLQSAPTARDALRLLQEFGYGEGETPESDHAYEAWIDQAMDRANAYLEGITPDKRLSDALLCGIDAHNLKVLLKGKALERDVRSLLRSGGMLPLARLEEAVEGGPADLLPPAFAKALRELRDKPRASMQQIDIALDAARVAQALEWSRSCPELTEYFRLWADKANILALMRLKNMGRAPDALSAVFLPGGRVTLTALGDAWDSPDKLRFLPGVGPELRAGLAHWQSTGSLSVLERELDDALLRCVRPRREGSEILPLIGYYLALDRECAMIRLCMVAKINGLPATAVHERMRALYG